MKHKYIVRSRHSTIGSNPFIPVNRFEAATSVLRPAIHVDGPDIKDFSNLYSSKLTESIHKDSVFKRSSPVSQDIYKSVPQATLDMGNTYSDFCPTDKSDSATNPRLAVLENFKEISRIMTQNFITHKKIEKRYQKT